MEVDFNRFNDVKEVMKCWIIGSWVDVIAIAKVVNLFNVEYITYIDAACAWWQEISSELFLMHLKRWVDKLIDAWATQVVVPPVWELLLIHDEKYKKYIIPLFTEYLYQWAFKYSLVGKIWYIWGRWYAEKMNNLHHQLATSYQGSEEQLATKSRNANLPCWVKPESIVVKLLQAWLSSKDRMVNKIAKKELRYFFDAGVDTIVPLDWSYLLIEKVLKKRLNRKKTRFHGKDLVKKILENHWREAWSATHEEMYVTDTPSYIKEQRRYSDVLLHGRQLLLDDILVLVEYSI